MRYLLWILLALFLFSCSSPKEKIPDTMLSETNRSEKIVIYQMMTRLFGNTSTTNKKYGTIEDNGVGKFNHITPDALRGIKTLGISHVWYTGVLEHAVLTDYTAFGIPLDDADVVKGRAGSPYSIKDYYDVNPDLAVNVKERMQEFEQLIQRTHNEGLKVIIDFVPNHVARAYRSDAKPEGVKDLGETDDKTVPFKADNNFYYLVGQSFQPPKGYVPLGPDNTFPTKDGQFNETPAKVTGNNQFTASPGVNEWFESVKLNYGVDIENGGKTYFDPVPDTWKKMLEILIFWSAKKVDGFRCDMAEMVPVEFWNWAIPQVKATNNEILFIAEIYNPNEYSNYVEKGHFDFLYDKVEMYDLIRLGLMKPTEHSTIEIDAIKRSHADKKVADRMLRFLENHDEQRLASPFFADDAWKAVPAMAVSALLDKGPVMIYFGQEVGEAGKGDEGFQGEDGRTTIFDYWGVPEHQKWMNGGKFDGGLLSDEQKQLRQFYGDILTLAKTNRAIALGDYIDLTVHNVNAKNCSNRISVFSRRLSDERLIVLANFNDKMEHVKVEIPAEAAERMGLIKGNNYIGRDLLRSGADIGLNETFAFELDAPANSAFVFKIK